MLRLIIWTRYKTSKQAVSSCSSVEHLNDKGHIQEERNLTERIEILPESSGEKRRILGNKCLEGNWHEVTALDVTVPSATANLCEVKCRVLDGTT